MRTIAILGRGPSGPRIANRTAGAEVWGIGVCYQDALAPLDRLYEIHPRAMLTDPHYNPEHWEHLTGGAYSYTVVTSEPIPEITRHIVHPLADVLALQAGVQRAGASNPVLTSSVDFAISHAILELWVTGGRIELYGVDMGSHTEYAYQRPGLAFWVGLAAGHGIAVDIPNESQILRGRIYAIEPGGQMVGRQTLEDMRARYASEYMEHSANLLRMGGRLQERVGVQGHDVETLAREYQELQRHNERINGALQMLGHLIEHCDMQEPDWQMQPSPRLRIG